MADTDTDDVERAPCKKCGEQIRTEALRCPECGHEPGKITAGTIVGLMLFAVASVVVTWVIHPFLALVAGFVVVATVLFTALLRFLVGPERPAAA